MDPANRRGPLRPPLACFPLPPCQFEQTAGVLASGRDASLATTNALAGKGHWSTRRSLMTRRSGIERIHEALRNSESFRVDELSCTVFSFSSGTRAIGSIAVILAETVGGQLSVRPVAAAQTVVLLPVFGKRSGNTP